MYDRGRRDGGGSSGSTHPKNAVWALYCRSMLLANFCGNIVPTTPGVGADTREARETTGEALHEAWNEAQAIQDALDAHVCNLYTAVAYLCRENVYK